MSSFNSNKPFQIDVDHESVTIAWNPIPNAKYYELSMKTVNSNDSDWVVLSNKLTNYFARKKNLKCEESYQFRVRYSNQSNGESWSEYSHISDAYSPLKPSVNQPAAPSLISADSSSITISWEPISLATGYKLQYRSIHDANNRSNTSIEWNEIGSVLTNTNAKKKNLVPNVSYHFRVCPVFDSNSNAEYAFSKSSDAFHVVTFPANLATLLPKQVLQKPPTSAIPVLTDTQALLSNKVIGIYFSAHWCGPCRQFTPMLTSVYKEAKRLKLPFEVVFCSADHGEAEFKSYYGEHMPWAAVPYDDDSREMLQGTFKVNGIPRLVILNGTTGGIIANNALDAGNVTVDSVKQWTRLV